MTAPFFFTSASAWVLGHSEFDRLVALCPHVTVRARARRSVMPLDSLRSAARSLRRQPAFVSVVVLSLALGIALNTTMYGMLDALLRPRIAVRDPAQLYWIRFYGDYKWHVDAPTRDTVLSSGLHTYESVTRAELAIFAQQIQHDGHFSEGVV